VLFLAFAACRSLYDLLSNPRFFSACFGSFATARRHRRGAARAFSTLFPTTGSERAGRSHSIMNGSRGVAYARMKNRPRDVFAWQRARSCPAQPTIVKPAPRLRRSTGWPVLLLPGATSSRCNFPDPVLAFNPSLARSLSTSANSISYYFFLPFSLSCLVQRGVLSLPPILFFPSSLSSIPLVFSLDPLSIPFSLYSFSLPVRTCRLSVLTAPDRVFPRERTWHVSRPAHPHPRPEASELARAFEASAAGAADPIVAGGCVILLRATDALLALCEQTGIPVGETGGQGVGSPTTTRSCRWRRSARLWALSSVHLLSHAERAVSVFGLRLIFTALTAPITTGRRRRFATRASVVVNVNVRFDAR